MAIISPSMSVSGGSLSQARTIAGNFREQRAAAGSKDDAVLAFSCEASIVVQLGLVRPGATFREFPNG